MTRFARAKGSKASNERIPNEATPWHVMKEQLTDNTAMINKHPAKAKSAKELLSEKNDLYYCDTIGNVNNEWAEFSKKEKPKKQEEASKSEDTPKTKKKKKERMEKSKIASLENGKIENDEEKCVKSLENGKNDEETPRKMSKKRKSDVQSIPETISEQPENISETKPKKKKKKQKEEETVLPVTENEQISESKKKKKVKKKKEKKKEETEEEKKDESENCESKETSGKISKRHKRNQKRKMKIASLKAAENEGKPEVAISGVFNAAGNDWSSNVNFGKPQKSDESNETRKEDSSGNNDLKKALPHQTNGTKRKAAKIRDDKEHKRRKPDIGGSIKCIINGLEVEIVKYDGFPVKKEDADRLKDLRKQMIMKGIPNSEINAAMKLERRKAEKALTRVKKQVCFHCRKAGHNLSDCPELGNEEAVTGICFKCGSTEHTHFECKVTKKEEFRFASCFICREQGHIAKQCPDNPKGLYPQGGACKMCGDVTHLKKDCPELTMEKEQSEVTLGTITENSLESLDNEESTKKIVKEDCKTPKSKVVKF